MGEVLPFVRRRNVFDPDLTSVMGNAYDEAVATVSESARDELVIRELIAKRIMKTARTGVVDREQLCKSALSGFGRLPHPA